VSPEFETLKENFRKFVAVIQQFSLSLTFPHFTMSDSKTFSEDFQKRSKNYTNFAGSRNSKISHSVSSSESSKSLKSELSQRMPMSASHR